MSILNLSSSLCVVAELCKWCRCYCASLSSSLHNFILIMHAVLSAVGYYLHEHLVNCTDTPTHTHTHTHTHRYIPRSIKKIMTWIISQHQPFWQYLIVHITLINTHVLLWFVQNVLGLWFFSVLTCKFFTYKLLYIYIYIYIQVWKWNHQFLEL